MAEPSSLPLQGRAAIVTGSSRGIGRAIAAHLASLGAHVLVNYVANATQADILVSELNASYPSPPVRPRAIAFRADVSSAAEVKAMFDAAERAFGGPAHILVASAGLGADVKHPKVAAITEENWDAIFAVNAQGGLPLLPRGCQPAGPRRRRADHHRVDVPGGHASPEVCGVHGVEGSGGGDDEHPSEGAGGDGDHGQLRGAGAGGDRHVLRREERGGREAGGGGDPAGAAGGARGHRGGGGVPLATDAGEWVNGQVIRANGGYV